MLKPGTLEGFIKQNFYFGCIAVRYANAASGGLLALTIGSVSALIVRYRFDGDARDSSRNNAHATVRGAAEYVEDGKINAAGIAELKKRMPFADFSKLEANPEVQNFGAMLTVGDMVRFVEGKIAAS